MQANFETGFASAASASPRRKSKTKLAIGKNSLLKHDSSTLIKTKTTTSTPSNENPFQTVSNSMQLDEVVEQKMTRKKSVKKVKPDTETKVKSGKKLLAMDFESSTDNDRKNMRLNAGTCTQDIETSTICQDEKCEQRPKPVRTPSKIKYYPKEEVQGSILEQKVITERKVIKKKKSIPTSSPQHALASCSISADSVVRAVNNTQNRRQGATHLVEGEEERKRNVRRTSNGNETRGRTRDCVVRNASTDGTSTTNRSEKQSRAFARTRSSENLETIATTTRGRSMSTNRRTFSGDSSICDKNSKISKQRTIDKKQVNSVSTKTNDNIVDEDSDMASDIESESESEDEHMKRLKERKDMLRQRPNAAVRSRSLSRNRGVVRNISGRGVNQSHPQNATNIIDSDKQQGLSKINSNDNKSKDRRAEFARVESTKSSIEGNSASRNLDKEKKVKTKPVLQKASSTRSLLSRANRKECSEETAEEDGESNINKFLSFLNKAVPLTVKKETDKQSAIPLNQPSTGLVRIMTAIGSKILPTNPDKSQQGEEVSSSDIEDDNFKIQRQSSQRRKFEDKIKKHRSSSKEPPTSAASGSSTARATSTARVTSAVRRRQEEKSTSLAEPARGSERSRSPTKQPRWEQEKRTESNSPMKPQRLPSMDKLDEYLGIGNRNTKRAVSNNRGSATVAFDERKTEQKNVHNSRISTDVSFTSPRKKISVTGKSQNNFVDMSKPDRGRASRKPSITRSVTGF